MPDFDAFERLMIKGLSCADADVRRVARDMTLVPYEKTPKFAQPHRNTADLEGWLIRGRQCLKVRRRPGETDVVHAGHINQIGKDLKFFPSGRPVEIKSGDKLTSANSGIGPMSGYMGDRDESELKAIISDSSTARRAFWKDRQRLAASKEKTNKDLERYFRARLTEGQPAPRHLADVVRAIAFGFTTKPDIQGYLANGGRAARPLTLKSNFAKGLVPHEVSFLPDEQIRVVRIYRRVRVNITLRGATSGVTIRFLGCWKNDGKDKDTGEKIPARDCTEPPCFQFTVTPPAKHPRF
jgi:hypothetical protein